MNLNSKDKTILVFADPHQEIGKVEYILNKESYDIAVCLGDWFDSFDYNTKKDVERTCNFIKKWIDNDNFITLRGNHDVHYLWDNYETICSGYTKEKDKYISENFGESIGQIRDKFIWYCWIDEFLCTHAGLSPYHLSPYVDTDKIGLTDWLDKQLHVSDLTLVNGGTNWAFNAGIARGGRQKIGGITWCDFRNEFASIDNVKQIVGHTEGRRIRAYHLESALNVNEWSNICIDCNLNEYLIIRDGKLTIKKYIDLT